MSDKAREPARPLQFFVALVLALVAVTYPTFDYDLYWHLANGREMWSQGRILEEDVFSYTQAGTHYRNPEWLAQLIFFGLWLAGGMLALFIFKLAITAGVVAFCWRTLAALGAPGWWAAVVIALSVLTGFFRFIERPELFSLLGLAFSMALIICTREGVWPRRVLYLLPVLLAVWECLHGAVFGMVLLAGAVFAENLIARFFPSAATEALASWRASLNRAAGLTLLLSLINPYGILTYGIFAPVISNGAGFNTVQEWGPPGLRDYWLFFVLLAVGFLGLAKQRSAEHLTEFLWFLGFGVLAARYSRVTGEFALVALPWFAGIHARLSTARGRQFVLGITALLLAIGLYVHKFSPWSFLERRFGWEILEEYLPVGSVNFALDQDLRGAMFNTGHFGGYLAFALFPHQRIFHYNLPKVWGDTYRDDPAMIAQHGVTWAISGRSEELQRLFPRNEWAYVFLDGASILALRRLPGNADLISTFEVKVFHPNMGAARLAAALANPVSGERMAFEAAVYCAYRRNPILCGALQRHLESGFTYSWGAAWIPKLRARQVVAGN